MSIASIQISLFTGIIIGILSGYILSVIYKRISISPVIAVLIILSAGFALSAAENSFGKMIPFASMIAVMCMGIGVKRKAPQKAVVLSEKFGSIWSAAEIFLFVLVGASVAIDSLQSAGLFAVLLIPCVLVFRMLGVFICVAGTRLSMKERLFCMLAYTPKATVQAAIGGLPLAMGLACGQTVLTVSVIAILLTAPLGAFAIDLTYKKLLPKE